MPSGDGTVSSLVPRICSAAPHSSVLMCADSAQITASCRRSRRLRPRTLAAVEHEKHVAFGLEQLAQSACGAAGPLVLAVRCRVAGICGHDRVHYGLMGPGVVVASETLVLSHAPNLLRGKEAACIGPRGAVASGEELLGPSDPHCAEEECWLSGASQSCNRLLRA